MSWNDYERDARSRRENRDARHMGLIEFVSLQDLKGSIHFGGEFRKLEHVATTTWDVLVIDEAHEGIDTYRTDAAFDRIRRGFTLHLSGTPFKALANDKFPSDAIYNWTYADEQAAKRDWDGEGSNPYATLPRLNMFTYQMSEIIRDELLNLTELWQNLDCAGLQRLAEDIATASEIFIIGQGTSSTYARELSRMLGTLGINSRFTSLKDPEQFAELELALGRDPLMITFAFPRYSKPLLMRIRALKQRGLRLVSITDRIRSPYASLADYYFTLPVRSFDFADSHCAGMAWINILSITIALRNKEKVFSKMQEREMHIDEMNMFL
jgi:DNA-binding MurR/RpiR family transcriptional regulator